MSKQPDGYARKNKRLSAQQLDNVRELINMLEYPLKLEAWVRNARAAMLVVQDTLLNTDHPMQAKMLGDLCDELELILPEQDHE